MADGLQVFDPKRFCDVRRIGVGNHATVFRAWDRDLERRVALKISMQDTLLDMLGNDRVTALGIADGLQQLVDELADETNSRTTLLHEARLLARVDHPNVVAVLDVGLLDGTLTVVMPYLSGGHLGTEALELPWTQVLDVALEIGEGLAALHEVGLLHRDFKPNNILFDERGRPHIADLGLACRIDDEAALAEWPGTLPYMAPETRSRRFRDQRDDLYAYCVVVFQMFFGHLPFASPSARLEGCVSRIERDDDMPSAIVDVLERGLHPDADSRWPDMPTLLAELRRAKQARARHQVPYFAAMIALALALALALFGSSAPVHADECVGVADELEPIWNRDIELELRGALGSRAASEALRDWATRWLDVRTKECKLAVLAGHRPWASACAERMRVHFATTLEVLQRAELREGLDYAVVIEELPVPERCLEYGEHDPASVGVLALRERDAELRVLLAAGDHARAAARLDEYVALARAHESRWDLARALVWRAELDRLAGDLDRAEQRLRLAYARASAIDADELGAEAMLKLATIAGARNDIGALEAYALAARAVFEREDPDRVAELLQVHGLGLLSGSTAERERAVVLLDEALALREQQHQHYGGSREQIGRASEALARGLLAAGRPDRALAAAQRSLEIQIQATGPWAKRTHALWRLVFVAQVRLGRLREAIATVEELALPLAEDQALLVDELLWIASVYAEAGYEAHAAEYRAFASQRAITK